MSGRDFGPRAASDLLQPELIAALDNSPLVKLLRGPDGGIAYANPAFCELLGYRPEQLRAEMPLLSPPEDRQREQGLLAELRAGRLQAAQLDLRLLHCSGRAIEARVHVTGLCDPGGAPSWILCEVEDLSAAAAARWELELAGGQLEQALALARAGEWEFDFASERLSWTEPLCRLLAQPPASQAPDCEQSLNLLIAADREQLRAWVRESRLSGTGFDALVTLADASMELRIQARVRLDSQGRPTGLNGLCIDHSEALRLARQQLEASLSLARMNARLRELASLVSSTLDETLHRISSLSQGKPSSLGLLDEIVSREIERLDDIGNELRSSQAMADLRRPISLPESLKRARRLLEDYIERQRARIEADFRAWDQIDYVPACFDQIMLHLLEQALGSGAADSWPEIRLRSLFAEGQRLLEVERLGPRMEPGPESSSAALTRTLLEACGGRLVETAGPGPSHTLTVWF